jgi:superfamily II DNA helicase RecQ
MPLLTQYRTFFISPFGEPSVCDELNSFIKSHRVVNVEKRLIDGERGTGWLFLVEYSQENAGRASSSPAGRVDYREVLSEQEYALFEKCRVLRKELAEKQGLPVYAVFTNEQLAGMIKKKVSTLKDIAALPGTGESRVKQYGGQFLQLLAENAPPQTPAAGEANETGELPL